MSFLSDFISMVARHDLTARPLLEFAQWLKLSGRVLSIPQYEDEPDTEQAFLWRKTDTSSAGFLGTENALSNMTIRPGPGTDLGYWMAQMPSQVSNCLSSLGHDSCSEDLIDGFALWTPNGEHTQVVHISTRGAFAAPIGTPTDFLRVLSLPIRSLTDALNTGIEQYSQPNVAYRQWLDEIGISPANNMKDALPNLCKPDNDSFHFWLKSLGYADQYFMVKS